MKSVQWPAHGTPRAYRRGMRIRVTIGVAIAAVVIASCWIFEPSLISAVCMITGSFLGIWMMWAHSRSRCRAQQSEIIASFADLHVIHHKQLLRIRREPFIGAYMSRREAVLASLDRGDWAVIVRAYGRWYALAAEQQPPARPSQPISFRTRAVADVVPSVVDTATA